MDIRKGIQKKTVIINFLYTLASLVFEMANIKILIKLPLAEAFSKTVS